MNYLTVNDQWRWYTEQEVKARVECASRVIAVMNQASLSRREQSKKTKLRVVNAMIMLVFM